MPRYRSYRGDQRVGLLIVAIGALFLLDQFDILHFGSIIGTWWPIILVLIGLIRYREGQRLAGLVLLTLGGVFLLANLDILLWHDIARLWPLLLIIVGLSMAFGGGRSWAKSIQEVNDDQFEVRTVFGGSERRITSQNLRAGAIETLFGGAEIDLRDAKPAEDCRIRISVTFGGVEVRVPEDWRIVITGTPILGGISDQTRQTGGEGPVVRFGCSALFGGIEIRN